MSYPWLLWNKIFKSFTNSNIKNLFEEYAADDLTAHCLRTWLKPATSFLMQPKGANLQVRGEVVQSPEMFSLTWDTSQGSNSPCSLVRNLSSFCPGFLPLRCIPIERSNQQIPTMHLLCDPMVVARLKWDSVYKMINVNYYYRKISFIFFQCNSGRSNPGTSHYLIILLFWMFFGQLHRWLRIIPFSSCWLTRGNLGSTPEEGRIMGMMSTPHPVLMILISSVLSLGLESLSF